MLDIPMLGAGLGFREELSEEIYAAHDQIDFVEIIADQYTRPGADLSGLRRLVDTFTVIPHAVGLSIGTMGPVDMEYLAGAKRVSDTCGSPYFSDHLCMTKVPGIDLGHLAPLWFTEEVLANTIEKVKVVQDVLGKPLVLENVTYVVDIPGDQLAQPEFFRRLTDATGCGVLLDVTNLYTNAVNHLFDADTFMAEMPLDHVVQVHLAGGFWRDGILIDGHSDPVPEEVWELYAALCARADIKGALLEQDQNLTDIKPLLEQVWRARKILNG
ncbi:DUF692 domain-containing protein [Nonomuraea mesophila]|uniref:DUF692 domain-containing protein n=1 Tax=Nonomuraea mesophila TaxID=2530382 RepID=A0A4V2ZAD4_9ACTN|nr:DUF692 domain-containing protein [Nonomuraea mesophila]TDE51538.1 DUF692 domain-containing protein [Nonomuraea mesophila]